MDLARATIFLTRAGSHAHGTARAGSDLDLRGVCIVPLATRLSLFEHFEQYEGPLDAALAARIGELDSGDAPKIESVVYDVAKLLSLCAAANPNALELLFADERDWLLHTPQWHRLHDARRTFLTHKVQDTYLGYALAQLQKIERHRGRLESDTPIRAGRNPARAELERRFGYDTKHAMHLIRLLRMGLEVLRTGELLVRRPDAEELLAIRDGALSFDELLTLATDLQSQFHATVPHPSLARDIDAPRIDALLLELIEHPA